MPPEAKAQLLLSTAELPVDARNIKLLLEYWGSLFSPDSDVYPFLAGIEVVSWRSFSDRLIASAHTHNIPVINHHSKLGPGDIPFRDFYQAMAIDAALNPLSHDLKHYPETNILIHAPYADLPKVQQQLIAACSGKPGIVWIENHPEPYGVEAAYVAVTDLRKKGVNARVMFDTWHAVCTRVDITDPDWVTTSWQEMINYLSLVSTKLNQTYPKIPLGIHFATGHEVDIHGHQIIPIEHYTDEQLIEFFNLCKDCNISHFVLEGSVRKTSRRLFSLARTPRNRLEQSAMNRRTLTRLTNAGLLDLCERKLQHVVPTN